MTKHPQQLVTKIEFEIAMHQIDRQFLVLEENMYTKADHARDHAHLMVLMNTFSTRIDEIVQNMYTKADHAKFMEWMDEAMTELRDSRTERKLGEGQLMRLDDTVHNHEKRIQVLEKKS